MRKHTLYFREQAELNRFREYAKGDNGCLDANKFIPYPEIFALLDKISPPSLSSLPNWQEQDIPAAVMARLKGYNLYRDGYNQGGYEWCKDNWGTKWNFSDPELNWDEANDLSYDFETAWSPPTPVIKKMSEIFPKLEFLLEYREEGVGFQGQFLVKGGRVIEDISKEYKEED